MVGAAHMRPAPLLAAAAEGVTSSVSSAISASAMRRRATAACREHGWVEREGGRMKCAHPDFPMPRPNHGCSARELIQVHPLTGIHYLLLACHLSKRNEVERSSSLQGMKAGREDELRASNMQYIEVQPR